MAEITPIVMPKWGLSMQEGTVIEWLVDENTRISVGMPILEVETDKIANAVEATDSGLLRRKTAAAGDLLPVKALLGVMAEADVIDADIDAYIAAYVAPAVDGDDTAGATPAYQHVVVDGIRLRYARKGAGEGMPVLLIHGYGGDLDNWLFNIDTLAEKAPVIVLDLPGHGESDIALPGASVQALAGFVARFLNAIEVPRAHLVGHSMGASIAAQMALDDVARAASLTLIGAAGLGDEINADYINGFVAAASRRELKPVLELLFADASLVSRQMVDDVLRYKRLDGVGALLGELGDALYGGGRQSEQPGLKLGATPPLLVIWGRDDKVIPALHASGAPAGARTKIFDGAGHMVQLELAGEVNRLIIEHIGG